MRRRRHVAGPVIAATLALAALIAAACSAKTTSKTSPAVVATADSVSRVVTFGSPAVSANGSGSGGTVTLNGHVFGSGPTGIVLAHERPSDQTSWFPFATTAAAAGRFTVLTFDFRGYGASGGQVQFDKLDTDLSAAVAYMQSTLGAARVFLVGASMGGTASLVLGARQPVAGIVSISSPAQFETLDALEAEPQIAAPELFISSQDDVPARNSL